MVRLCKYCSKSLETAKEWILKICNSCAKEAKQGFVSMSKGKFKEGIDQVMGVGFHTEQKEDMKKLIKHTFNSKQRKIMKKARKILKKEGFTDEQIDVEVEKLKEGFKC